MKELENIEEQFRQELLGMDVPPARSSEELWEGISAQLNQPQKKRRYFAWATLLLALLGIGFLAGYSVAKQSAKANKLGSFEANMLELNATSDSQKQNTLPEKGTTANSSRRQKVNRTSASLKTERIDATIKTNSDQNTKTTIKRIDKKDDSFIGKTAPIESSAYTTDKDNTLFPDSRIVNTSEVEKFTKTNQNTFSTETPLFATLHSKKANLFDLSLSQPKLPLRTTKQLPVFSSFQLGISYTPCFLIYPEQENLQTKAQLGHGVHLYGEKTMQRIHIGAGLQWQQMGYHFLYKKTEEGTYTYTQTLLEVIRDENMNIVEEIYGDTTVRSVETTEVSHNNRYTLFTANLYFRFAPFKSAPRTTIGAGITGFKTMTQNARYLDRENDFTQPVTTSNSGLRTWGWMPYLTLDQSFPLTRAWSITSSLRLSYLPQTLWSTTQPSYSFIPSLGIGIRRTFIRS